LRIALLAAIATLFVLSIPWYRDGGEVGIAVALVCYAATAVLNALAWLLTDISDGDGEGG
jgi:hypothetical protein